MPGCRRHSLSPPALAGAAACSLLTLVGCGAGISPGEEVPATELAVGDCVDLSTATSGADDQIDTVLRVSCSRSHDAEVYASVVFDDGDYPVDVRQRTQQRCRDEFADFVGLTMRDSEIQVSAHFPTEESWGQGDRTGLCLAQDPDGGLSDTLRGSKR